MRFQLNPRNLGVLVVFLSLVSFALALPGDAQTRFASQNGDANGDGERDLTDVIYILNWLFRGGPEPVVLECPPQSRVAPEILAAVRHNAEMRLAFMPTEQIGNLPQHIASLLLEVRNVAEEGTQAFDWDESRFEAYERRAQLADQSLGALVEAAAVRVDALSAAGKQSWWDCFIDCLDATDEEVANCLNRCRTACLRPGPSCTRCILECGIVSWYAIAYCAWLCA